MKDQPVWSQAFKLSDLSGISHVQEWGPVSEPINRITGERGTAALKEDMRRRSKEQTDRHVQWRRDAVLAQQYTISPRGAGFKSALTYRGEPVCWETKGDY